MKQAPVMGAVVALVTLIGTAVGAVWSARNHAEVQVQRLENSFRTTLERHEDRPHLGAMTRDAHDKDLDQLLLRLDKIEAKIDQILILNPPR